MNTKSIAVIAFLSLLVCQAYPYGPRGHEMVGAIADEKLAGKPAGKKAAKLLGGVSLAEAALFPDKIKDLDLHPPRVTSIGKVAALAKLTRNKKMAAQFLDFWEANPPTRNETNPVPSHHW